MKSLPMGLKILSISLCITAFHFCQAPAAPVRGKSVSFDRPYQRMNNSAYRLYAAGPFSGKPFYVNRLYTDKIRTSIESVGWPRNRALQRIRSAPTAIWLVTRSSVARDGNGVAHIHLQQASTMSPNPMVTFVIYNLPNRDCGAGASEGELCCNRRDDGSCDIFNQSGYCDIGIQEYKYQFIDPLVSTVREFCGRVPMSFIIEPDSVPNLVANGSPACGQATSAAYRAGVKYAVENLHLACSSAPIYVDAAHGGWLGWEESSVRFAEEIRAMEIASKIRGFSINLSGFQEMGILCPRVGFCNGGANSGHPCCQADFCSLSSQYNQGFTLLNYASSLRSVTSRVIPSLWPYFVIDTSRNGVPNSRKDSCANWCNVRDAGVGPMATSFTAAPDLIDAYLWIKPPGESDGCTRHLPGGQFCPRFAAGCESADSIGSRPGEPRAPEGGQWFEYSVDSLARNGLRMGTI